MSTMNTTQGGELRGILCRVGTPSEPDAITGCPRILISTDEESLQAVERLPMLKPVVVIEETAYATLHAQLGEARAHSVKRAEAYSQLFDEFVELRKNMHVLVERQETDAQDNGALMSENTQLHAQIARMKMREGELVGALKAVADEVRIYPESPRSFSGASYLPRHIVATIHAALQSVAKEGEQPAARTQEATP